MAASSPAGGSRAWTGASGRRYERAEDEPSREGTSRRVIPVFARGAPRGDSMVSEGTKLALQLPRTPDPIERATLLRLSGALSTPPTPRVFDLLPAQEGLLTEWCPSDLEQWWLGVMAAPEGLRGLLSTLAEICRRLHEYGELSLPGEPPAQIRPRALVRRGDGRWLISRLAPVPLPDPAAAGDADWQGAPLYLAPEILFQATRVPHRAEVWAVGTLLFAMLRLRAQRRREAPLPPEGSDSPHLRSHRLALVTELYRNRPALFRGRELDPRQFLYPDALPDPDRHLLAEATRDTIGDPALELDLAQHLGDCLQRCLAIDPRQRHADLPTLAEAFEQLARRFRAAADQHRRAVADPLAMVVPDPARTSPLPIRPPGPPPPRPPPHLHSPHTPCSRTRARAHTGPGPSRRARAGGVDGCGAGRGRDLPGGGAAHPPGAARRPRRAPPPPPPPAVGGGRPARPLAARPGGPDPHPPRPAPGRRRRGGARAPAGRCACAGSCARTRACPCSGGGGSGRGRALGACAGSADLGDPSASDDGGAGSDPGAEPGGGEGRIEVTGASEVYLEGPAGRVGSGSVPAGVYRVYATVEGRAGTLLGTVDLEDGQVARFSCGFGTCKQTR